MRTQVQWIACLFLYVCCCLFCTDLLGRHRREHHYGEYYCTDTAMNAKISIERPRHPSLPTTSGRRFESGHKLQTPRGWREEFFYVQERRQAICTSHEERGGLRPHGGLSGNTPDAGAVPACAAGRGDHGGAAAAFFQTSREVTMIWLQHRSHSGQLLPRHNCAGE